MGKVNVIIDGRTVEVEKGATVLEAAKTAGIYIPTLCYLKDINKIGACRVCLVEIKGARGLQASCVYPVSEGMEVYTNTETVREARKAVVELIISNHPQDCLKCTRSNNCELQNLAKQLGITDIRFKGEMTSSPADLSSKAIERNPDKCILCRRCVAVCSQVQGVDILRPMNRGFDTIVTTAFNHHLEDINCTLCGQCINVCPVEAIKEKDHIERVWTALNDQEKHVVVQTAPSVRAVLGEEFGLPIGTSVTGKMITALRMLGFDKVFDTDFSADLTIMEEGNEFLERLTKGENLPLITSCSPGWIKYCEHHYPELIDNLSTCKSPQQMFGALVKTYYAEHENIDREKIFSVSIMPCTAKKYEADRPEMNASGYQDVDAVLTVRELARMIKQVGIDFNSIPDGEFDLPMGMSTGAGLIFGATGGVMEAALRTVCEVVTGETLGKIEFEDVRGLEGIKEATINLNGNDVKVAVAHGLSNAKKVMEKIKTGEADYHFIEIMACPGGCIGGGGTPIVDGPQRLKLGEDYKALRIKAIYGEEKELKLRKSHENPAVKKLYESYLGKPLSKRSHELLHTHYQKRNKYPEC
ncbi:MAG: 2Fe-2S iron-sulfur cluster binding domain-containing protein [Clostridia bacterium]|jgi:NADP-reducing hydrogenase subunit HndD|nr:2Fe-2S iron-sulfur cluster binding domain-containing protein [Clostridia bacterium]